MIKKLVLVTEDFNREGKLSENPADWGWRMERQLVIRAGEVNGTIRVEARGWSEG